MGGTTFAVFTGSVGDPVEFKESNRGQCPVLLSFNLIGFFEFMGLMF